MMNVMIHHHHHQHCHYHYHRHHHYHYHRHYHEDHNVKVAATKIETEHRQLWESITPRRLTQPSPPLCLTDKSTISKERLSISPSGETDF